MKTKILLLALLSISLGWLSSAYAQVQQAWVARFTNGAATALKVDDTAHVYVTGATVGINGTSDFLTVKYDANGNQLWVVTYDGPSNSVDSASALAIDSGGNVHVAGISDGTIATVKYDSGGQQLWAVRYRSPEGSLERPSGLVVDNAGNVYVSSSVTLGNVGDYPAGDYLTVKYDRSGNELWAVRYDGPAHLADHANAMVVDGAGNAYVTGSSVNRCSGIAEFGITCFSDYATVKYGRDGQLLWVAHYRDWEPSQGWARAIAVDSAGHVYVTGESRNGFCGISQSGRSLLCPADYATVAYDEDGNQLWVARYSSPIDDEDAATAIAVDSAGNVLVTGWSTFFVNGDEGEDFVTIKYGPQGNELWIARYGEPSHGNEPSTIAVDPAGNVYVTGFSYGGNYLDPNYSNLDYATVKYDSAGNQLWTARYNGPANRSDTPSGMVLDSSGNVYVAGRSYGGTHDDFATIKYVQTTLADLPTITTRPQSRSLTEGEDVTFSVTATGAAPLTYQWRLNGMNILGATNLTLSLSYVQAVQAGEYSVVVSNSVGVTVSAAARLVVSPLLQLAWLATYGAEVNPFDSVNAMAVDNAGNVYVTGYVATQANGDGDYATVKYDASGNQLWAARYNGPGNGNDEPRAIAVDAEDNVYVTGRSIGAGAGYDYATLKYGPQGNQLWVRRYHSSGSRNEVPDGLAVDSANNVYIAGSPGTVKYDANGNQRWAATNVVGNALAVDRTGNVHVAGSSYPPAPAAVKYDANGNQLWLARSTNGYAIALGLDGAGNVYVTSDLATVKYDPNGNQLWVARHDVAVPDFLEARASAVDDAGSAYVAGYGSSGIVTIKYAADGPPLWVRRYAGPAQSEDSPWAVNADAAGNVYVTGYVTVYTPNSLRLNFDIATLKYDSAGHQIAVERLGASSDEQAYALALDSGGNVYVAGFSFGSGFVTAKYVQHPIPTRLEVASLLTNGAIGLTLTGEAQRSYEIQASPDLTHWAAMTCFFNGSGTIQFNDPLMTNLNQRFYRVLKP